MLPVSACSRAVAGAHVAVPSDEQLASGTTSVCAAVMPAASHSDDRGVTVLNSASAAGSHLPQSGLSPLAQASVQLTDLPAGYYLLGDVTEAPAQYALDTKQPLATVQAHGITAVNIRIFQTAVPPRMLAVAIAGFVSPARAHAAFLRSVAGARKQRVAGSRPLHAAHLGNERYGLATGTARGASRAPTVMEFRRGSYLALMSGQGSSPGTSIPPALIVRLASLVDGRLRRLPAVSSPLPSPTPTPQPVPPAATITDCPRSEAALINDIARAGEGGRVRFGCDDTIVLSSTIIVKRSVTLDGQGHAVTISGQHRVTVFEFTGRGTCTLNHLTIANGRAPDDAAPLVAGGGIAGSCPLIIINSTFRGNSASGGGGGINASGTLTVTNSTFSGNSGADGGGISSNDALTVTNSTFSGNSASGGGAGGGISVYYGTASVTNSTFSGNSATGGGAAGGISISSGTLTVTNSTFSGNSAPGGGGGGGISAYFGTARLANSIVANSPGGVNCSGKRVIDLGGNVDDGTTCISSSSKNSLFETNPLLGPLANNGGPTQTMALLPGSPAATEGVVATCTDPPVNGRDQRGVSRGSSTCSSGAY
jgi:predicted outer membrane repeat protein